MPKIQLRLGHFDFYKFEYAEYLRKEKNYYFKKSTIEFFYENTLKQAGAAPGLQCKNIWKISFLAFLIFEIAMQKTLKLDFFLIIFLVCLELRFGNLLSNLVLKISSIYAKAC